MSASASKAGLETGTAVAVSIRASAPDAHRPPTARPRTVAPHEPLDESAIVERDVARQMLQATTATGEPLFRADASLTSQRQTAAVNRARDGAKSEAQSQGHSQSAKSAFCARWLRVGSGSGPASKPCEVGCADDVASLVAFLAAQTTATAEPSVFAETDAPPPQSGFTWVDLHGIPAPETRKPSLAQRGRLELSTESESGHGADTHSATAPGQAAGGPPQDTPSRLAALWHHLRLDAKDVARLESVEHRRARPAHEMSAAAAAAGECSECAAKAVPTRAVVGDVAQVSAETTPDAMPLDVPEPPLQQTNNDGGDLLSETEVEVAAEIVPSAAMTLADLYYEALEDLHDVDGVSLGRQSVRGGAAAAAGGHYAVFQLAALLGRITQQDAQCMIAVEEDEEEALCDTHSLAGVDRGFGSARPSALPTQRTHAAGHRGNSGATPIVGLYVLCLPTLCVTWCPSSTLRATWCAADPQRMACVVEGWDSLQQSVLARAGTAAAASAAASLIATRTNPLCTATFLSMLLTTVCSAYLPDTAAILSDVDAVDDLMPQVRPECEAEQAAALRRVVLLRRQLSVHRRLLYQKVRLLEALQRTEVSLFVPFLLRPAVTRWSPTHLSAAATSQTVTATWAVSALSPQLAPAVNDLSIHRALYEDIRAVQQRLDAARVVLAHTTIIYTSSVTVRNSVASTGTDYFQLKIGFILLCILPMNLLASHWGMNGLVPWQTEIVSDSLTPFWALVGAMAAVIVIALMYPMWLFFKGRPELIATL